MAKDEVVFVGMVLAFTAFVTAHVAIAFGLAGRSPRWRALAALLVVPLAPYWATRERMHARTALWLVSAIAYLVLRVAARS